jgi:hypothetical protein
MAAGSIIIDLLMRTGSFQTDTARAEKRLKEFKREAEQMGKVVGAAAAAAAVALGYMVKQSINAMDELGKMAQKAGTTTEALSALGYAADLSGVNQEQLTSALVRLSKGMSDAAQGTGEAIKAFDALGISIKNTDGTLKTSDQVLTEVAGKLAGMRDGAEKTALAVALFGRSGADLIPLLNAGKTGIEAMRKEAEQFGIVVSGSASKASEEFNDNITRITTSMRGMITRMTADALPVLNNMAKVFLDIAKNQDVMNAASAALSGVFSALTVVMQTVLVLGANIGFVFQQTGREIGAWVAQLGQLASGNFSGVGVIRDAAIEQAKAARAALDQFERQVMGLGSRGTAPAATPGGGAAPSMTPTPTGGGSGGGSAAAASISAAERQIRAMQMQNALMQRQIELGRELNNFERLQVDLYMDKYGLINDEELKNLERNALLLDMQEKKLQGLENEARIKEEVAKFDEREAERQKSMLSSMLASGPNAQLELQRKNMQLLAKAFEDGAISAAQFKDAATGYLGLVGEQVQKTKSFVEEMGMSFTSAFEDAVLSGKKFSDVLKGLARDIAAIAFRKNVTEPLGNMFTSAIGGSGGGFGGILSSLGRGIASIFSGGRATGGPTQPGRSYLVGENGPEMFVPNTAGQVLPGNNGTTVISSPQIQVNVINNTGTQVQSSQRTRQDGGITQIDVMLETIEGGLARKVQSGSGPLSDVLARQFGMNRAAGAMI